MLFSSVIQVIWFRTKSHSWIFSCSKSVHSCWNRPSKSGVDVWAAPTQMRKHQGNWLTSGGPQEDLSMTQIVRRKTCGQVLSGWKTVPRCCPKEEDMQRQNQQCHQSQESLPDTTWHQRRWFPHDTKSNTGVSLHSTAGLFLSCHTHTTTTQNKDWFLNVIQLIDSHRLVTATLQALVLTATNTLGDEPAV